MNVISNGQSILIIKHAAMPDKTSPSRNRNRHCFVFRSPPVANLRQINDRDVRFSNYEPVSCPAREESARRQVNQPASNPSPSSINCCCPPPELKKPRRQDNQPASDLSPSSIHCCCPPPEVKKPRCCVPPSEINEPQAVHAVPKTQFAASSSSPSPSTKSRPVHSSSSINCCCPPPEPKKLRCCVPKSTLTEPLEAWPTPPMQLTPAAPTPAHMPPRQIVPNAPPLQPLEPSIEEPSDPYYAYNRNHPIPAANPLANFDLNRFDRDQTVRDNGYGRRRNVSIRTCVDYDYEPGNHAHPYERRAQIPPLQTYGNQSPLYPYVPYPAQLYPAQLYPTPPPGNPENVTLNPHLRPEHAGYPPYDPYPYHR